MQKRAVRFTIVALLLASGVAAAFFVWRNEHALQALENSRRNRELVIERLAPALSNIASAQQAYVDYGLPDEATLERVAALIREITSEAAGLRASPQSPESAAHLEEFWVALAALTASAGQAEQRIGEGESLAAADLLLSTAQPHVSTLEARLRGFREAEFSGFGAARGRLVQRSWMAVGGIAALWLLGLIALARVPSAPVKTLSLTHHAEATAPHSLQEPAREAAATDASLAAASSSPAATELSAAADLCTTISRLTDSRALPRILERAAGILDARGLIVWMGAGDELFAVAAYGYQESIVSRLPPIKRRADNATAAAWRHGELRTVPADAAGLGAIVAPMFDGDGCVGVLAAEVRNGREAEPAARAITGILASQLALVLAAWPASSAANADADAGSDRQAAAS